MRLKNSIGTLAILAVNRADRPVAGDGWKGADRGDGLGTCARPE